MNKRITYKGIAFLHHEETYEIRKNQTGTIRYYTREDNGESGMSLRGLANGCGISVSSLWEHLNTTYEVFGKTAKKQANELNNRDEKVFGKNYDFYLIQAEDDAHVICDIYCERIIYYYAFESLYKKTKARELYQALAQHGLRTFIHSKTGYQAQLASQHDTSITESIEEQLKREVEELKLQLVEQTTLNAEKDEKIRQLEYHPIYEKTYQAHLYTERNCKALNTKLKRICCTYLVM